MVADVEDEDNLLFSAIIGGDTGLLAMAALSSKLKMSRARARLINIGGVVGTLYGLGTNILFEVESERTAWGVMGIGSVLGLAAGAYFTRNYDAEKGYFAGRAISLLSIESGERQWNLPVPTITVSHLNSRPACAAHDTAGRRMRIPNLKLQIPLVNIKF